MSDVAEMREWPQRLQHNTPGWVKTGSLFHIRVRAEPSQTPSLTTPDLAAKLLAAAKNYHVRNEWHCLLFLLMPDHLHALLAFPPEKEMAKAIGSWKRYTARFLQVKWQTNFFDHRLRRDESVRQTWDYILRNPVVKDLCREEEKWRWAWAPD